MPDIIRGKVFVVGDNIDTDQIIPAQYLNLVPTMPEEYVQLGRHALSGLPDSYPSFVEEGETETRYRIIVAGRNFGCGSSREHAPVSLGAAGVAAVVAESFARIFFRNCIATGEIYPMETPERLCDLFETGEEAMLDLDKGQLVRCIDDTVVALRDLGDAKDVIANGGLFDHARKAGMLS